MEGRKATPATLIGIIVIMLTLDLYTFAEATRCPRCPNNHGLVNCALYHSNCVSIAVNVQIREIRVAKCAVTIVVNGKPPSHFEFPIVRSIHGIQCHDIFAPKLQTTQPEPDHVTSSPTNHTITSMVQPEPAHVTARPTTQTMTSTVQPEPAHVTARPTTQTMTSTVQPEPAHVTARPTTQTITSTVQPEPAHVTAWSTTHTITSMVQPEPAHVTARSTLLKMLKTVKAPTKALNVPDTDDDLFDEAGTTGFFAWAVLTTIALILLIVKKLVLQRCDLKCCTQPLPSPPQPQTIEPFEDRIPMNPIMHTPPSQASTPDTPSTVMSTPDTPSTVMSTPNTPSTVTSSAPLVSQHEPVSANTRSKKKLF